MLLSVVTSSTVWPVIGFMVLLGWPQISRIARGSVITAKQNDYVQAARALGASNSRMLLRHIAPNAVAPVIVVATIALGTYISLEATLSYLGVGLKPPTVSWGIDISAASAVHPQRPAHAAVARRRAGHHRAGVHHARRRGARRPRPQAALREPPPMLLEVRDLHVEFRTRDGVAKAVNGVNYSVDAGETLAVLGESGSGKSVTAQASWASSTCRPGGSPAARSSSRAGTC